MVIMKAIFIIFLFSYAFCKINYDFSDVIVYKSIKIYISKYDFQKNIINLNKNTGIPRTEQFKKMQFYSSFLSKESKNNLLGDCSIKKNYRIEYCLLNTLPFFGTVSAISLVTKYKYYKYFLFPEIQISTMLTISTIILLNQINDYKFYSSHALIKSSFFSHAENSVNFGIFTTLSIAYLIFKIIGYRSIFNFSKRYNFLLDCLLSSNQQKEFSYLGSNVNNKKLICKIKYFF